MSRVFRDRLGLQRFCKGTGRKHGDMIPGDQLFPRPDKNLEVSQNLNTCIEPETRVNQYGCGKCIMPSQPYLPTFNGKRYSIGFDSLKERPAFAAAIGRCINIWSYVDNEIGGLFGILLKTDSEAAHRVFLVLRKWSNQREALNAAAEGTISNDEMAVYSALIEEYRTLEAQRNELGHGCFGICPDDEDLLFVINVRHHVLWQADILPKHLKGVVPADSHEGLKEKMYVYRMLDLESLYKQMEQLWWDMFYFNGYLQDSSNPRRGKEFKKLFESPRIQQRIAALKQN